MVDESAERRTIRYETVIATLVGVLALLVSAYTAYVQRQQVRAQVWPILEYGTSNSPSLRLSIDNKGVGPAIIRHVVVTVDGEALPEWKDVLERLLGPGKHPFSQSQVGNHILSAGESMDAMLPTDHEGQPLKVGPAGSDGARFNEERYRVGVELCYCSTLGDCWTLHAGARKVPWTSETRRCPAPSARTFQQ